MTSSAITHFHVVLSSGSSNNLGSQQCGELNNFSDKASLDGQTFSGSYKVSGKSLNISYDMYNNADKIQIFDGNGVLVYDPGYVGTKFIGCNRSDPIFTKNGGCQGLSGPERDFEPWPCPTVTAPVTLPISGPGTQVYRYLITSACSGSAWALKFDCV